MEIGAILPTKPELLRTYRRISAFNGFECCIPTPHRCGFLTFLCPNVGLLLGGSTASERVCYRHEILKLAVRIGSETTFEFEWGGNPLIVALFRFFFSFLFALFFFLLPMRLRENHPRIALVCSPLVHTSFSLFICTKLRHLEIILRENGLRGNGELLLGLVLFSFSSI